MGTYANKTTVGQDQSRAEIERVLDRYGATSFAYFKSEGQVLVAFEMRKRRITFKVVLPAKKDFSVTDSGRSRKSENAVQEAYEQAVRQRWRALALVIKAKLESVDSGIETFEEAFLAQIMLPDGQPVGQWMAPQIKLAYETAQMPPLLSLPSGT